MSSKVARLLLSVLTASGIACASAAFAEPSSDTAVKSAAAQGASDREENLPPVLPPEQFFGPPAMGYAAAKSCPQVCHHLFCYCGCDITDKHKSLLDCFTGYHGVDCHICQEEAMLALRMTKSDEPLAAIQKAIDEAYSNRYPFKEESPALKSYKALRKWHPAVGAADSSGAAGGEPDACCAPRK